MGQLQTREKRVDIKEFLRSSGFEGEMMKLVGSLDVAKRMSRVCLTQVMKDDKLLQCTPESLFGVFYELASLGLEPGRDAYLIPRGGKVTCIIKAEGYMRAARNSGDIRKVWSDVIRAKDEHAMVGGSEAPHLVHNYMLGDRGPIIGAYAVAEWTDGTQTIELVDRSYLDNCRAKSDNKKNWDLWPEAYCRKSVTRRLCKKLPLGSDDVATVSTADADPDPESLDPDLKVVENETTTHDAAVKEAARQMVEGNTEPQAKASSSTEPGTEPEVSTQGSGAEVVETGGKATETQPPEKTAPENPCKFCSKNVRNKKRDHHVSCADKHAAQQGKSDGADTQPATGPGPKVNGDGRKLNSELASLAVENDLTVADLGAAARKFQPGHKGGALDATDETKQKVIDLLSKPGGDVEIENIMLQE